MKHVSPEQLAQALHYRAVRERILSAGTVQDQPQKALVNDRYDQKAEELAKIRQAFVDKLKIARSKWDEFSIQRKTAKVYYIISSVATEYGIPVSDIKGRVIRGKPALARQNAYYRLYHELPLSKTEIGKWFGSRSDTTVDHGIHRHAERHDLPVERRGFE